MSHNQFVEIGTIQRTHGINGELQVVWSNDFSLENDFLESVFIEIDGIPIPFFITSIRSKGSDKALIFFEDIDDINLASELVNARLLLPEQDVTGSNDINLRDLIGYTLISEMKQIVGKVTALEDYQTNLVFTVAHSSGIEMLIPAAAELIIDINPDTQTVVMEIPEGLLELYLE